MAATRIVAFQTPSKLELRGFQQALDSIRQSLRALDSQVSSTQAQAGQTTLLTGQGQQRGANLQQQITELRGDLDQLEATLASQAAAPAAAPLPSFFFGLDGEDGADGIGIPGPAGADGISGDSNAFLSIDYAYGDSTPAFVGIVPAGMRVVAAEVAVDIDFDGAGAALTVGPMANPAELAGLGIDPATEATYESAPQVVYPIDTPIFLFITPGSGASRGAGAVLLQLQ